MRCVAVAVGRAQGERGPIRLVTPAEHLLSEAVRSGACSASGRNMSGSGPTGFKVQFLRQRSAGAALKHRCGGRPAAATLPPAVFDAPGLSSAVRMRVQNRKNEASEKPSRWHGASERPNGGYGCFRAVMGG